MLSKLESVKVPVVKKVILRQKSLENQAIIEVFIGQQIRKRRLELKISQVELGKKLSVSFQQIQKYESAKNRLPAKSLMLIAKFLKVDLSYFYPKELNGAKELAPNRLELALKSISDMKSNNRADQNNLEQLEQLLLDLSRMRGSH